MRLPLTRGQNESPHHFTLKARRNSAMSPAANGSIRSGCHIIPVIERSACRIAFTTAVVGDSPKSSGGRDSKATEAMIAVDRCGLSVDADDLIGESHGLRQAERNRATFAGSSACPGTRQVPAIQAIPPGPEGAFSVASRSGASPPRAARSLPPVRPNRQTSASVNSAGRRPQPRSEAPAASVRTLPGTAARLDRGSHGVHIHIPGQPTPSA